MVSILQHVLFVLAEANMLITSCLDGHHKMSRKVLNLDFMGPPGQTFLKTIDVALGNPRRLLRSTPAADPCRANPVFA